MSYWLLATITSRTMKMKPITATVVSAAALIVSPVGHGGSGEEGDQELGDSDDERVVLDEVHFLARFLGFLAARWLPSDPGRGRAASSR